MGRYKSRLEVGVNRRIIYIRNRCVHIIDGFNATSPLRMREPFDHFWFFIIINEYDHCWPEYA